MGIGNTKSVHSKKSLNFTKKAIKSPCPLIWANMIPQQMFFPRLPHHFILKFVEWDWVGIAPLRAWSWLVDHTICNRHSKVVLMDVKPKSNSFAMKSLSFSPLPSLPSLTVFLKWLFDMMRLVHTLGVDAQRFPLKMFKNHGHSVMMSKYSHQSCVPNDNWNWLLHNNASNNHLQLPHHLRPLQPPWHLNSNANCLEALFLPCFRIWIVNACIMWVLLLNVENGKISRTSQTIACLAILTCCSYSTLVGGPMSFVI